MKKVLILACLMAGMLCACSSDGDSLDVPEKGDFVANVSDKTGTVRYDKMDESWYINTDLPRSATRWRMIPSAAGERQILPKQINSIFFISPAKVILFTHLSAITRSNFFNKFNFFEDNIIIISPTHQDMILIAEMVVIDVAADIHPETFLLILLGQVVSVIQDCTVDKIASVSLLLRSDT